MTKEDIAEILCMVGNAILSKSKKAETTEEVSEGVSSEDFGSEFEEGETLEPVEPVSSQPIQQVENKPVVPIQNQSVQAINSIFTPASVPVEIQNMLQQKESQIASLQSQLSAVQTSNLGFTPIKL